MTAERSEEAQVKLFSFFEELAEPVTKPGASSGSLSGLVWP